MILKTLEKKEKNIIKSKNLFILYIRNRIRCFMSGTKCNKEIKKTGPKEKDELAKDNIDKVRVQRKNLISTSTIQSECIQWLTDPMKGERFKKLQSTSGRNFISGKEYPYPSNPTFKPPIPLSLNLRKDIERKWKQGKSIKEISEMFGISFIRVKAVLRLLKVESKWHQEVSFTVLLSLIQQNYHYLIISKYI
ncbi:uncharacterized protein T551_02270 [Pneumocystis jirovecii RU7]|uniref:Uncharacterized protein n=1 Tax=Pneumocystis jirovecii (strain RU7) TaxID=1408657 RepID=A0A0W4ZKT6_PNEJ7|nr:uncharacterized protein T551_02270 [Pneumocystis jirovecii RU7]KTW28996.1 hypothetical protein T551_02270 [Pneumocystis jirovecii RU7]